LHGEPNVQTPEDALRTLKLSGLKHVLFDTVLVSKA
jgi:predicted NodU family carbamoyl transferase